MQTRRKAGLFFADAAASAAFSVVALAPEE
jgi:hypothetical protein